MWRGVIEKYSKYLPVTPDTPVVTLCEGNTPLVHSETLSKAVGAQVYLKYEGLNPTGSFKDRGMTMALSKAKENGAKIVICASTGNTSASAAAYAAKAGMKCVVLIPEGAIALGKLSQALIHNAKVIPVRGNFDHALGLVRDIARHYPITLVNSVNPYRLEGQKTASFEICDALQGAPDFLAIPVGNAGNITAYWKGFQDYKRDGKIFRAPRMIGFQAQGAAPIVRKKIVPNPKTIATAIKIGNPASWRKAEAARDESGGIIDMVSDKEILQAYKWIAQKDGIFAEPASAAGVAGILKKSKAGYFKKMKLKKSAKIVCVLTGHGLKDPDCAMASVKMPASVPAKIEKIIKEIGI